MSKFMFVTGGVVSWLEKDLASASIGKAWGQAMSKSMFVTGGVVSWHEKDLASASIGKAWGQP